MPYVGDDVHRATTKRKWDHDGSETLRFSHPGSNATVFHVLNQQAGLESTVDGVSARKTLPPTKRLRAIHDDDDTTHSAHWRNASSRELLVTTSQVAHDSNDSACKAPVKIGGMTIMPCHVCHRRPTKKSDLDSFARCQSCQEQTCFVCIRECRRQKDPHNDMNSPPFGKEDEDVGQSFKMNDADECDMAASTNIHAPQHDDHERQDTPNKSSANSSIHHAMICSRCCVEEGAEGEVVCLGCLSNMDTA
ncbi:uncharacterized protein TrAtP1_000872 [Trichoderma atroviride]|uniref:Uncharacterized protein n=1 Tax=Hypocrea atroviridis (strain ATCC 20476 / IMI 206040) TaxID=452589 RepID=G9NMM3_HYPAI|nr:uncharacterized protein TRIATDRAFT_47288 [Trichoderma atroviride IMI 206040]EHK48153.1 hypothetical protein TRIATDRAFT_47288 [Trichoderma atroviride IMI 206040]UKZ59571.1 hypothetical protein TrAtP1_000872 [Trichoderma atroviride]